MKWIIISLLVIGMIGLVSAESKYLDHSGIRIEPTSLGAVRIWDLKGNLVGALGFSTTGNVGGVDFLANSYDWSWVWKITNKTYEIYEYNETDEYLINVTDYILTGYNLDPDFNITQIYYAEHDRPIKITTEVTNYFTNVEDYKLWYINTIEKGETFSYNNFEYSPNFTNDIFLHGNFNDIFPNINFGGTYTFSYSDLIKSGFNITDVYIGNASYFDAPTTLIMAIGISEGDLDFGEHLEFDPALTGYKSSTSESSSGWTNPQNVRISNNIDATSSTTAGDYMDLTGFDFGLPDSPDAIHGIKVQLEATGHCSGVCAVKSGAWLGVNLSWDGGTSWTSGVTGSHNKKWIWSGGESVKYATSDAGGYTELWGRAWTADELNETNFVVRVHFWKQDSGNDFASPGGVDYVAVDINYTGQSPNLTWVEPTPEGYELIGSTFRFNYTSDILLDEGTCYVGYNITYPNGTNVIKSSDLANWEDRMGCYDEVVFLNGSKIHYFNGHADAGGVDGMTGVRHWVNISSTPPVVSLVSPIDNEYVGVVPSTLLNFSFYDAEDDTMNATLWYGVQEGDMVNSVFFENLRNATGSYAYNLTYVPESFGCPMDDFYAYYNLNNRSDIGENDTFVVDLTGKYNGTMATGGITKSCEFDGCQNVTSGKYISIGNTTDFSNLCLGDGCTIVAWVNPSSQATRAIIGKYDVTDDNRFFRMYMDSWGDLSVGISGDGSLGQECQSLGVTDLPVGVWTQVVFTYINRTGVNAVYGYANKTLSAAADCSGDFSAINATAWQDAEQTFIGTQDDGSPTTNQFQGRIDNVIFYNRSFNSTEIHELYELEANHPYYWNITLDEGNFQDYSDTWEFTTGVLSCNYNCGTNPVIDAAVNCNGGNLTFSGSGTVEVGAKVTNYDYGFVEDGCEIRGFENFF